jgi:microcystin synthetase protein McyJ
MRNALSIALKTLELGLKTPRLLVQRDAVRYYEFLGDDVIEGEHAGFGDTERALWLNLGYWREALSYPQAASALACLLADRAELSPGDTLLDVGFGFGEQDLLWAERYGVAKIIGVNVTPLHVERAQARVRARGLEGRIDLRLGSATALDFAPASFDKVTALECAHHFDTRETFFAQAFSVLRPGGRGARADGLPLPGQAAPGWFGRMVLRRWAYVLENFYDRDAYCDKLRAAGFVEVRCTSIREQVYPGICKYADQRRRGKSMQEPIAPLDAADLRDGLRIWEGLGVSDYVIITADKPG